MRKYTVDGIVIGRKNSNEADRILTVFTKQLGKILVKAVGVRKITSRRASSIELLNYVRCSLYKGQNFPILTEVQVYNTFPNLKNDLKKMLYGYHICELIQKLCPENQENSKVFTYCLNILQELSQSENMQELVEEFEGNLLQILGFYTHIIPHSLDTSVVIEQITEKRLKVKPLLTRFF